MWTVVILSEQRVTVQCSTVLYIQYLYSNRNNMLRNGIIAVLREGHAVLRAHDCNRSLPLLASEQHRVAAEQPQLLHLNGIHRDGRVVVSRTIVHDQLVRGSLLGYNDSGEINFGRYFSSRCT